MIPSAARIQNTFWSSTIYVFSAAKREKGQTTIGRYPSNGQRAQRANGPTRPAGPLECAELTRLDFDTQGFTGAANRHLRHPELRGDAPGRFAGQPIVHQPVSNGVTERRLLRHARIDDLFLRLVSEQSQLTLNETNLQQVGRPADLGRRATQFSGYVKGNGTRQSIFSEAQLDLLADSRIGLVIIFVFVR